jgi:translation initiation factor 2 subunit 3
VREKLLPRQPEINIGTTGHVDHGKTTLVQALTGIWTARHSEELKRGVSIRIGYADAAFMKCPRCPSPQCYTVEEECPKCGKPTELLRTVSFVDCPGHEVLMTTMLAGAAVMDGALLVIAANEPVPQPQTREHLAAIEVIGIKSIVVAQNKVELVSREEAVENYNKIREFLKGTVAEGAPIIPVSAQHSINVDALIEAIERGIPTPERDLTKPPRMFVVRSFDVNRPGTPIKNLRGGVVGGTILQGEFKVGDEVEISPGVEVERGRYEKLYTRIVSLHAGGRSVERARAGGLVGVGTLLDPSLTKADGLIGNVVGKPGTLPPVLESVSAEIHLFDRAVGTQDQVKVEALRENEQLVVNVGTSVSIGVVKLARGGRVDIDLRRPICAEKGARVAINRRIHERWRLVGYGVLTG